MQYYLIYRNDELVGYSETNSFVDEVFLTGDSGALLRYAIAAVDFSGNKSQQTPDVQVVISSVSGLNAESVQLINSPNPFVESTLIMFELTENSQIELSVTDLTGKQIRVLADREFSPGAHQIEFNAAGLSSGVYFCRLRSADGVKIHKMILR